LDGLQRLAVQNRRLRLKRLDFCESYAQLGEYPGVSLPDGRAEFARGDQVSEEERIACFALEVLPLPLMDGKPVASLEGEQLLEMGIVFDELAADRVASRTVTQVLRVQATQEPARVVLNGTVATWVATQKVGTVPSGVHSQAAGRCGEIERLSRPAGAHRPPTAAWQCATS
jgi:hypothetical protein